MAAEPSAGYSGPHAVGPVPAGVAGRGGPKPVLLDGSAEGRLLPHLIDRLRDPDLDRIDMAVSFVMKSGLARILEPLEDALDRGARVRILTTDYLAITDPDALTQLADLAEGGDRRLEVRLFSGGSVAFHPKAYIFWSSAGETAAGYVGSSNLSASGIDGGVEWNLGVDRVEQLVTGFDSLWTDGRTRSRSDPDHPQRVSGDVAAAAPEGSSRRQPVRTAEPDKEPSAAARCGREILRHLTGVADEPPIAAGLSPAHPSRSTRGAGANESGGLRPGVRRHGHRSGQDLARRLRQRPTGIPARAVSWRTGRRSCARAGTCSAGCGPMPTWGSSWATRRCGTPKSSSPVSRRCTATVDRFAPAAFTYVVIDEFHHAAAATYRRVLAHFEPRFLLGLTATPDRRDGADLLALCGDNLVFDCGLAEGIGRQELSPFHYWGIADVTDYDPIPWRSGRFDPATLATAIETRERAAKALHEWRDKGGGPTLAFCSSISHAEFMKAFFVAEGVPSAAVHSGGDSDPRHRSIAGLQSGEVEVLFTVDVFNEGVDIPEVETVLMLRPTDSPVVFLQQLGRGLRRTAGKAALQVIDFVGNHHSFLTKPRTLLSLGGRTPQNREVLEALQSGDFELPPGCSVDFDLEAIEILSRLSSPSRSQAKRLEEFCRNYESEHGIRPTAAQAFSSVGLQTSSKPVSDAKGWHRYLNGLGLLAPEEQAVVESLGDVLRSFEREPITKAYKLVTLTALLKLNALHTGAAVSEVASESLTLTRRDPRLRADTEQTREVSDLDSITPERWRAFWMKNPLTHLTDKPHSLFRLAGERLEPRFDVQVEHADTFATLVAEVVEWRLQIYIRNRSAKLAPALAAGLEDGELAI